MHRIENPTSTTKAVRTSAPGEVLLIQPKGTADADLSAVPDAVLERLRASGLVIGPVPADKDIPVVAMPAEKVILKEPETASAKKVTSSDETGPAPWQAGLKPAK